jgi:hypothetical protein
MKLPRNLGGEELVELLGKKSSAEKPISLKPLKFDEAVSDLLKVKPEPKSKSCKFSIGQRIKANEKAPGDYEDREGIITDIKRGTRTLHYGVQFDPEPDKANKGYLDSWMLDPVSS